MAGLEKASPSLPLALPPHLLGTDLASPCPTAPAPKISMAREQGLPEEAAVLLMKGLYRPPSADSCSITHRPGTGAHLSGAGNTRGLGFLILGQRGVHIKKY